MKKQFNILLICIVASTFSFGQYRLTGKVMDETTGNGLPDVTFYLTDLKRVIPSGKDGVYEIKDLKKGLYLLEISLVGYKSNIQRIQIQSDTVINFSLSSATKELSDVVVTGVSHATELKMSPISIKSVNQAQLNQNSSTNLIDALKNVPGVSQITTGAAVSKPVIRGLGYNRIITLNDGTRQEGQQWGDEHGIEIDEYSIDRVEIIKGPGSLMYGSDGIAGVLNFLPAKFPSDGVIRNQFISNYQSNNNLLGYSFMNAGNKNDFQWLGRFSNKYAGNYKNRYDGKVYNSGFKELNGSFTAGINKNWGHSSLTVSSYNNTLNLPEGERNENGQFIFVNNEGNEVIAGPDDLSGYKIGFPHQEVNHLRIASSNYFILKKGTLRADLAWQNNKRKEFADAENPDDIELYFNLNTLNYNIRYNLPQKNGWETAFGTGGMQQTNRNLGEEVLIPEYSLFDVGLFAVTQKSFSKKLTFAAGLRGDNRRVDSKALLNDGSSEYKFQPFIKNYQGISGSAGLSYQAGANTTLKVNISRGFRAPNLAELASNGRHEGTFRYEIGNPDLKPEKNHQIDAGFLYNSDHISFEFTPFVNFVSDFIFAEKLPGANGGDSIPDPTDPAPAFKFTSGDATLYGGEIYFDIHPHPLDWLHIENTFSYVRGIQNNQPDSTGNLPFIPAPRYRGEIRAQFPSLGKTFSNAYIKMGIDYFFNQNHIFSAFETETPTAGYTLLSAGMGANVAGFGKKNFLSLFLSCENLANIAYQNHLSRLKYAPENPLTGRIGIFNMGRNLSVKAVFNF